MAIEIRSPASITPDWFDQVLAAGGERLRVKSFTPKRVGTGQIGDTYRFSLVCEGAAGTHQRTIVGKFPSEGIESRQTGIALNNYLREVKFYQHLAKTALIHTPRVYFTDINEQTHDFVLMMEDLAPAEQGDQLRGVSMEQALLVMDEAAKLHASHWEDEAIEELPWVSGTRAAPVSPATPEAIGALWGAFCGRYGARVTPEAKTVGETLCQHIEAYFNRGGPRALAHMDFRPDNMMFASAAGGYPVTTLDWQSIAFGTGATDVAYFLAGAITVEQRREHEKALTGRYLDRLSQLGVKGYTRPDFERDYAGGSFQLFLTAFYAAVVVTQTARGDDMFFQMLNGATAQIQDTHALERLKGRG
jgi:hypothetical protein